MKTLMHEFLDIEAESFDVPQACYDTIDDILELAQINIDVEATPKDILKDISGMLEEYGFSYGTGVKFSEALQSKNIDCKEYSVLYYSIAEELRLPLDIVAAPNHLFVRWDDGKNVFNWETVDIFTSKEKIIEDSKYISEFNIHEKSILNGVYLKNLTSEELESIAFDLNGITKLSLKDFKGAIDDFNMSIELDPKSPNSYSNRGFTKIYFNDLEGALDDFNKSIKLDCNDETCYFNRGSVKIYLNDFVGAMNDFNKIIELNPKSAQAYYYCGIVSIHMNNFKKAKNFFDKAIELNPDLAEAYHARGNVKVYLNDIKGSLADFDKAKELNSDLSLIL